MSLPEDPRHPGKHIDPATGIWPISEWGYECQRGFHSKKSQQFDMRHSLQMAIAEPETALDCIEDHRTVSVARNAKRRPQNSV